ncbi:GAF domain-containing protein [Pelagicoccus sp. SDUM812003]|uniref:GAF domain-containing protein n=1 Tax=Pelagicoccus sp. SDUM812003 TaxID=3041267 RepID=UPI00280FF207|nr:GAF domain-containing protein [Pelagicoccus sp. SDUM812003]MDQ8204351.1 GAF domain-containing protein [Pelagicoccus sp. SDUM812003]
MNFDKQNTLSERSKAILHNPSRLELIARLGLFSDEARSALKRYTRSAARRMNLPVSLISLVLHDSQYFAASYGLDPDLFDGASGTPIEWSFCRFAVEERRAFVVCDAMNDSRVKGNPLVLSGMIGCYAGAPLISSFGLVLGTLCVIGTEPRLFQEGEIDRLRGLADVAMQEIELSNFGEN